MARPVANQPLPSDLNALASAVADARFAKYRVRRGRPRWIRVNLDLFALKPLKNKRLRCFVGMKTDKTLR
jgi:hypothetical protein